METIYVYQRSRRSFNKPCHLEKADCDVLFDIPPDPVKRTTFFTPALIKETQISNVPTMAEHNTNTARTSLRTTGMSFCEGGWPKEVDGTEPEQTARYTKKIEMDAAYHQSVRQLAGVVQPVLRQNNAIDIYRQYFPRNHRGGGPGCGGSSVHHHNRRKKDATGSPSTTAGVEREEEDEEGLTTSTGGHHRHFTTSSTMTGSGVGAAISSSSQPPRQSSPETAGGGGGDDVDSSDSEDPAGDDADEDDNNNEGGASRGRNLNLKKKRKCLSVCTVIHDPIVATASSNSSATMTTRASASSDNLVGENEWEGGVGDGHRHTTSPPTLPSPPPAAVASSSSTFSRAGARCVTCVSWNVTDTRSRVAVGYARQRGQIGGGDVSAACYVFDTDQTFHSPICSFIPPAFASCILFSPRDSNYLAVGCENGAVVLFDLRKPQHFVSSTPLGAHEGRAIAQLQWVKATARTMELFVVDSSNCAYVWDMRNPEQPSDTIQISLGSGPSSFSSSHCSQEKKNQNDGSPAAAAAAVVGTCGTFLPSTIGPGKIVVGTDSGAIVALSRRGRTDADRLLMVYGSHHGPVVSVARNAILGKCFLSAGDWSVKIWHEDYPTPAVSLPFRETFVVGSAWHPLFPAVLALALHNGIVELWDLLFSFAEPVDRIRAITSSSSALISDGVGGTYMAASTATTDHHHPDNDSHNNSNIITCISFNSAGSHITVGCADGALVHILCLDSYNGRRHQLRRSHRRHSDKQKHIDPQLQLHGGDNNEDDDDTLLLRAKMELLEVLEREIGKKHPTTTCAGTKKMGPKMKRGNEIDDDSGANGSGVKIATTTTANRGVQQQQQNPTTAASTRQPSSTTTGGTHPPMSTSSFGGDDDNGATAEGSEGDRKIAPHTVGGEEEEEDSPHHGQDDDEDDDDDDELTVRDVGCPLAGELEQLLTRIDHALPPPVSTQQQHHHMASSSPAATTKRRGGGGGDDEEEGGGETAAVLKKGRHPLRPTTTDAAVDAASSTTPPPSEHNNTPKRRKTSFTPTPPLPPKHPQR